MPEIVVLVAHPQQEHSRVNHALMQGAARAAPGRVEVRDLYALYPDYLIDVEAEQAQLAGAQLVVWQHPIHWYGMPPLMKLWLDEVFTFGWAYGPGGHRAAGQGPVAGGLDRRAGRVVPARRLQPLLLRRLPAALRADRRAGRHALPAAAAAARRAPPRRRRTGRHGCRPTRSAWPATPTGRRWPSWSPARPASCPATRAPRRKTEHGTRHELAADQPGVPGCGGGGGAAVAAAGPGLDHRLPGGGRGHRPLGAAAGDRCASPSCTSPSSAWC